MSSCYKDRSRGERGPSLPARRSEPKLWNRAITVMSKASSFSHDESTVGQLVNYFKQIVFLC